MEEFTIKVQELVRTWQIWWSLQHHSRVFTCIKHVISQNYRQKILTGNATATHRTNVMFEPASYENKPDEELAASLMKKKQISEKLKQKWAELTQVIHYRCPPHSKSKPSARLKVDPSVNGTALQRARSVIHALSRADNCDARPPPQEQKVPAYSGAQSCHYPPPNKSKPYYHTTYPEPPSKSLMHGIMVKLVGSMNRKNIVQLKAENPELFKDIVPILWQWQ